MFNALIGNIILNISNIRPSMSIYEEAWKNIVRPTQIKSKINAYGPK